jgi:hypothetical protein
VLRITGFKIDPDAFDDIEQKDLAVLVALVVRLREVIEEDAHFRESAGVKPVEEEKEIDFEYEPEEGDEEEDTDYEN